MNKTMATLKQLRIELGWSNPTLAKQAGVGYGSARKAEDGKPIAAHVAKAIADCLSKALERDIKPWEIEGMNIQ